MIKIINITPNKTLPDKPSELIRLAIKDLKKIEKNPNFSINMGTWYEQDQEKENVCSVCLAGSVMANTLVNELSKVIKFQSLNPDDFDESIAQKLIAVDNFREGLILSGISEMSIDLTEEQEHQIADIENNIPNVRYNKNPQKFKSNMLKIANELEKIGF